MAVLRLSGEVWFRLTRRMNFTEKGMLVDLNQFALHLGQEGRLVNDDGSPMTQEQLADALGIFPEQRLDRLIELGVLRLGDDGYEAALVADQAAHSKRQSEFGKRGGNPKLKARPKKVETGPKDEYYRGLLLRSISQWNNVVAPKLAKRRVKVSETLLTELLPKFKSICNHMHSREGDRWSFHTLLDKAVAEPAASYLSEQTWFQFRQFFFSHSTYLRKVENLWDGVYDGLGDKKRSTGDNADFLAGLLSGDVSPSRGSATKKEHGKVNVPAGRPADALESWLGEGDQRELQGVGARTGDDPDREA